MVQVLCVTYELPSFIVRLGLEKNPPSGHFHGVEGQVRYAGPRHHEIARLFNPSHTLEVENVENILEVRMRRKWLIGTRPSLVLPVFVVGTGVSRYPNESILDSLLHTRIGS